MSQNTSQSGSQNRVQGVIKFFNGDRGFGFCTVNGAPDVFVHARELKKSGIMTDPNEGDVYEFDVVPSESGKGPVAQAIKLISAAR